MITEGQNKQVIDFLLSKELPIDILSELHDHILSQIHEYQLQGMSFDEAFEKSKLTWKEDLEKHLDIYFGFNESKLVKKIYWSKMLPIYKKSLLMSLPFSLLVLYFILSYDSYIFDIIIFVFYLLNFGVFIYYIYFKYKQYYHYIKKYEYNKLSIYAMSMQEGIVACSTALVFLNSIFIFLDTDNPDNLFRLIFLGVAILGYIITNVFIVSSYSVQSKFTKAIDTKVKPYFPYLKANRFYK